MLGMLGLFGYPVNETPPFGAPPSKIPDAPFLFEYGQRTPSPSETALKLTLAPYRAYDASIGWWLSRKERGHREFLMVVHQMAEFH